MKTAIMSEYRNVCIASLCVKNFAKLRSVKLPSISVNAYTPTNINGSTTNSAMNRIYGHAHVLREDAN